MCGIAGFVNDMPIDVKCPVLQRMTDMIAHRGPDSEGHYIDEHAALGHRRLSIIDLGGGQQPIYNEDGSKVITFNGEIYNYQTLREELIAAGHTFTTKSDTEVLLHGYEQWGVDLLQRVRGMFTFVIWDKNKQELFGARDHFGIKPFYYAKMNGTFMYASEIKSLLRHPDFVKELNAEALKPYMTFQYPAIGETFFKGVYKLPEGHYFTYRDGKMDIHRYYDEDFREGKQKLGELVNSIDQTVCDSVKAHQIADVEVGSFLSSGVDSSYVAAVARPQHTYSIGFGKGTYNESQQAGELAELLKLNNTAESLTDEEAFAAFPRIQWHLDEPDSNPELRAAVLPVRIGRQRREGGAERRRRRRVVRRIHRLRRAHQIQAHQGGDSLAHASASRRAQGDRPVLQGQDLPGRMASVRQSCAGRGKLHRTGACV